LLPQYSIAIQYQRIEYDDLQSYLDLAASLKALDIEFNTGGNRIFYVALPPMLYMPVAQMIGRAGLSAENQNGNGWSRIVIEKPFGTNLKTAQDLDQSLHLHFKEHQIYRIDHYLAKETVQNLLMFRFANSLFEPIWNRRYIDYISIMATETLGIEHRAGYYEQSGILRDMFQNHMMQRALRPILSEMKRSKSSGRCGRFLLKPYKNISPSANTLPGPSTGKRFNPIGRSPV